MTTLLLAALLQPAPAASPAAPPVDAELRRHASESVAQATAYLRSAQQPDGSFADGAVGPAITGLVLTGLLRSKAVPVGDDMVARGLKYLETFVKPGGAIFADESRANYTTAICLLAFQAANRNGAYDAVVAGAADAIEQAQWGADGGVDGDSPDFGGFGYGTKGRPDLSNSAFAIEALAASGLKADDPAMKRAIDFVRRSQNYSGEGGNDLPQGDLIEDGGFYYTPHESTPMYNPGGVAADGGLRSYGSMTYAGLKSFIHAGLKRDDPRVQAAFGWIGEHYTLDTNPGLGKQGLYYYYHTFAKALDLLGDETFTDADGAVHHWRADLLRELVARQNADGSWTNDEPRWLENDPRLATAYALMAIGHATRDNPPQSD